MPWGRPGFFRPDSLPLSQQPRFYWYSTSACTRKSWPLFERQRNVCFPLRNYESQGAWADAGLCTDRQVLAVGSRKNHQVLAVGRKTSFWIIGHWDAFWVTGVCADGPTGLKKYRSKRISLPISNCKQTSWDVQFTTKVVSVFFLAGTL